MDEKKNSNRPDQAPPRQASSKPDPRQDEPTWNERHPQAPVREHPERRPTPQERGERASGISNRSMEEEQREQDELPERGTTRQSER